MSKLKQMVNDLKQEKNIKEQDKIKMDALEIMRSEIRSILKQNFSEYKEHEKDLMNEGYIAVLQTLQNPCDLSEEELEKEMDHRIHENMQMYVDAFC